MTASLGISFALLPVGAVGLLLLGSAYFAAGGVEAWLLGGIGFVVIVASIVAVQVLGMVARTALYRYATDGTTASPFDELDPAAVFPSK